MSCTERCETGTSAVGWTSSGEPGDGRRWRQGLRGAVRVAGVLAVFLPAGAVPRSALARPASPSTGPPAWALEVPGAAGARWGLGLDALRSETDDIAAPGGVQQVRAQFVTVEDDLVPGAQLDLDLNLNLDLELHRTGVQVPISLGSFRLGLGRAYLFTVLEGGNAGATVTTRFPSEMTPGANQDGDLYTVQSPGGSLDGDGSYYGASLGLAAGLGARQSWFVEGRARFLKIPSVELNGSLDDSFSRLSGGGSPTDGELDTEQRSASVRLGRSLFGGRIAPYLGVRRVSYDADLTTTTTLVGLGDNPMVPIVLDTDHHVEADTTDGVAGVDARLGRHLFARAESTFGDDRTLLLKVVRLFGGGRAGRPGGERPRPGAGGPGPQGTKASDGGSGPRPGPGLPSGSGPAVGPRDAQGAGPSDASPERARELARRLAPRLRDVLDALKARRRSLVVVTGPGGVPSYRRHDVESLLVEAEARLTRAIADAGGAAELAPLQDYFERRTDRVREQLSCPGGASSTSAARRFERVDPSRTAGRPGVVPAVDRVAPAPIAPRSAPIVAQEQGPTAGATAPRAQADGLLDTFFSSIADIFTRSKEDRLRVAVCVRIRPVTATLELCPFLGAQGCRKETVRGALLLHRYLGLYSFRVQGADGTGPVSCEPATGSDDPPCPLDLVDDPKPIFDCDLAQGNCARLDGQAEPCP